jgi:hypothetical protein
MREYLRWKRFKHLKECKEWERTCKDLKHLHNLELIKINAYNVLENKPLVRTSPVLPPAPVERIFIPEVKLREMVKECMDLKAQWGIMVKGITLAELLKYRIRSPLLKKLRVVKSLP